MHLFSEAVDDNDGSPPSLSDSQFVDNMRAIHQANDKTKHPAQQFQGGLTSQDDLARQSAMSLQPAQIVAGLPALTQPTSNISRQNLQLVLNEVPVGQSQHCTGQQEVTQYCPMTGCTFSSFKTHDRSLLSTCFQQLTLHLQLEHGISGTASGDAASILPRGDKISREYLAATKSRTVKNVIDDANHNLCEARFFPTPLDLKTLGQNMPVSISPVNTVVDMSHLGVDVTNADLIRKVHNRSTTTLRLKEFSDTNLRNFHAAGDELVAIQATKDHLQLGKKQKTLDDPQECIRAFFNYSAISTNFHVLDWSSKALMKVALEKYFFGPPTVDQFSRLFEKYIHENAVRAQRRAVPLTYQEVLGIWNTYITPSPLNASSIETVVDKRLNLHLLNQQQGGGRGGGGRGGGGRGGYNKVGLNNPNKKLRLIGARTEWCPNFNSSQNPPYCTNTPAQGGCTAADGKYLRHSCSKKVFGKFCNSDKHNYYSH